MNKSTNQHESISAMADGELSDAQLDSLLASLNDAECKDVWDTYHQIGDVLRSEELAITFSADFTRKLSAKLAAEPVILAPAAMKKDTESQSGDKRRFLGAYAAVASAAVAAIFTFMLAPQLQIFHAGQDTPGLASNKPASASNVQLAAARSDSASVTPLAMNVQDGQGSEKNAQSGGGKVAEVDMLRDPRIDSYLMAHQRFSPAINNGAQYMTHANAVSTSTEK